MPKKSLRIGFYGVTVTNDPDTTFSEILEKFRREVIPDDESRTWDNKDQPIRLQWATHTGGLWSGEIMRIRLHEDLNRAKRDGSTRPIEFEDDEGLGENTAFLFNHRTSTLVVHEARGAVSVNSFGKYFKSVGQVEGVELRPLMRPEAIERIASMGAIYSLDVQLEGMQTAAPFRDSGRSAAAMVDVARSLHAPVLHIVAKIPRTRGGYVQETLTGVVDALRGLMRDTTETTGLTRAVVTGGRTNGENAEEIVDLIEDRLVEFVSYDLRDGARISDRDRHNAVRTAWNIHAEAIGTYYTREP
jgi:hypothetical protein